MLYHRLRRVQHSTQQPPQSGSRLLQHTAAQQLEEKPRSPEASELQTPSAEYPQFDFSRIPVTNGDRPQAQPPYQTGLPDRLKTGIESLSGFSMKDVRVHYNSNQPEEVGALAYTQGTTIHLAPGQQQHLPHEAWHVVQQMQGRVQPTIQAKEHAPVNDDAGLEAEADAMGTKALQGIASGQIAPASFRLMQPPRPTGRSIQRKIPKLQAWKLQSAQGVGNRSQQLKNIDTAVAAWQQAKDDANLNNRSTALDNIDQAIRDWETLDNRGKLTRRAINSLKTKVTKERTKLTLMVSIQTNYGITLHNQAGIDAAKALYESFVPGKTAPKTKAVEWKLQELQDLEKVLSFYGPLLGNQRNVAKLGAQPISTFSRVNVGLDTATSLSGKEYISKDTNTVAETFTQRVGGNTLSNISIYDSANNASIISDFPGQPRKQLRGTIGHELSHALIESLPSPAGGAGKMLQYFVSQTSFWNGVNLKSNAVGAEKPITSYGETNAQEDLAESIMMFFEAPDRLKKKCPQRFQFLVTHVAPHLDVAAINQAWQAANAKVTPLAPPPPVVPPPVPGGVAPPAPSGITPTALGAARGNLRPSPPVAPTLSPALRAVAPALAPATPGLSAATLATARGSLRPDPLKQHLASALQKQRLQVTGGLKEDEKQLDPFLMSALQKQRVLATGGLDKDNDDE